MDMPHIKHLVLCLCLTLVNCNQSDKSSVDKNSSERNELIASHWKKINEYKKLVSNPSSYKQSGSYLVADSIPDIQEHLEALVELGEIKYQDVTIGGLSRTRELTLEWINWCNSTEFKDSFLESKMKNGSSFSFEIWYKPSLSKELELFIEKLRAHVKK